MQRDDTIESTDKAPQPVELITLAKAACRAPGRPSAHCVWRWCRHGVLSRNGDRVRLEHVRIGGKIFTSRGWIEDFGRRLAKADASHFDGVNVPQTLAPDTNEAARRAHLQQLDQKLTAEGL